MSAEINPIENASAWHVVSISGGLSYPYCEIVGGFERVYEWDVKKGKGAQGATITFVQRPPAKGSIKFYMVAAADFAVWDRFRAALRYDPTKQSKTAIDIYHPALADNYIASVVTEKVGRIEHEGEGLYSVTVDFLEFFPPPPVSAVSTPSYSASEHKNIGPNGSNVGNPLQSEIDRENALMEKLLQKAKEP